VNASRWDGEAAFAEWFSETLHRDFRIPLKVAQKIIDLGMVLPVLDSLDEMDDPAQQPTRAVAALHRLNESPWRGRSAIVLCRTSFFEAVVAQRRDGGLYGARRAVVQPLTNEAVTEYLEDQLSQLGKPDSEWTSLLTTLRSDPRGVVSRSCRSPWVLSLLTTAVELDDFDAANELASCRTEAEVIEKLFEAVIPAAVSTTPRKGRTREQHEHEVATWLKTLACYFEAERSNSQGSTDISQDQVWRISASRQILRIHGLLNAILTLILGGTLLSFFLTVPAPPGWMVYVLRFGMPVLILMFAYTAWESGSNRAHTAVGKAPRLQFPEEAWSNIIRGGLAGVVCGILVPVMFVIVNHFVTDPMPVTTLVWVGIGFVILPFPIGIVSMLIMEMFHPSRRLVVDERHVIRDNMLLAALGGAIIVLLFVIVAGIASSVTGAKPIDVGVVTSMASVVIPFAIGVMLFSSPAVMRFAIAALVFRRRGTFSPRPAQFLAWANNANLLRVTGVNYQFRHDTFQRWIATAAVPEPAKLDHSLDA
jgi:hypothetical protein